MFFWLSWTFKFFEIQGFVTPATIYHYPIYALLPFLLPSNSTEWGQGRGGSATQRWPPFLLQWSGQGRGSLSCCLQSLRGRWPLRPGSKGHHRWPCRWGSLWLTEVIQCKIETKTWIFDMWSAALLNLGRIWLWTRSELGKLGKLEFPVHLSRTICYIELTKLIVPNEHLNLA